MITGSPFERGPYLSTALLCERVLVEQDGAKSVIRIVDRITRTVGGANPPEDMPPFNYDVSMLIKLKSGWARGAYPLRVNLVKPSGESPTPLQRTVYFEGEEDRGVDIVANMRIKLDMTGIYWFHVYVGDVRMTQIPMRVVYIPQITQQQNHGGNSPTGQEPPTEI